MQFVNDLHALISPPPQGTPLPLILLGKVWHCCWLLSGLSTCAYFFYMLPITVQKCIIVDIFAAGPSRLGWKNWHLQGKEFWVYNVLLRLCFGWKCKNIMYPINSWISGSHDAAKDRDLSFWWESQNENVENTAERKSTGFPILQVTFFKVTNHEFKLILWGPQILSRSWDFHYLLLLLVYQSIESLIVLL